MDVAAARTNLSFITARSQAKRGARIRRETWLRSVKVVDDELLWDYDPEEFQRLGFGKNLSYRPTGTDKAAMDWVAA